MPLLYGEGSKAFIRLQEEIIKTSNDYTIFCWTWTDAVPPDWVNMLAPSPEAFKNSGSFVQSRNITGNISTYSMTNAGLSIRLPIIQSWRYYFVVLNAGHGSHEHRRKACIPISGFLASPDSVDNKLMRRAQFPKDVIFLPHQWAIPEQQIFVRSKIDPLNIAPILPDRPFKYGMIITVGNTRSVDRRPHIGSNFTPNLDQVDLGSEIFLVEKTAKFTHLSTFPQGLFDDHRSMFLFNYELAPLVYGGLLYFRPINEEAKTCLVVFLAIKVVDSHILWFCKVLQNACWGLAPSDRFHLLTTLAKSVALKDDDQLFYESASARATVLITEGAERSGHAFRVAHIFFGSQGLENAGEFLFDAVDDRAPNSDDDSIVPVVAHWNRSRKSAPPSW